MEHKKEDIHLNRYRPWIAAALAVALLTGCGAVEEKSGIAASAIEQIAQSSEEASPPEEEITTADTSGMDFGFDESDTQEAEASTGTALVISSGTLKVTAKNVGLGGKDCVKINSGSITANAGSDGIRSDNDEDASRGYVYLYGGTIGITAGNDGIQAETVVNIENVDLTVKAGGGSGASLTSSEESYKGIKAGSDIYITGGSFSIDSLDDCIHSNGTITISGGTISVVASDDGLNAAGGTDASSAGTRPGKGSFSASTGKILISGGTLSIRANGDGLDANGTLAITGGTITVVGPTSGDTAILDFDASGTISGGTFIGLGAASMAQNFSASSTQGVIMVTTGNQAAGTLVQLTDSSGNVLLSHTADQSFACVILSHPSILQGGTYTLAIGSSSTEITMTSTVYGGSGGMGGQTGTMGGGKGQMGMKGGRA